MAILATTFAWPGVEVANFNMILDISGHKKEGGGGTAYVAMNSLAVAAGGVLSGLLGSFVAAVFRDRMQGMHPILGVTVTYHGLLFAISSVLRAVAVLIALGLHEPKAMGTRAALQFMTGMFYSNVREAVTLPNRIVGQVWKWSFLITIPWRKRIRFGGDR
jgi:hypothetical protein